MSLLKYIIETSNKVWLQAFRRKQNTVWVKSCQINSKHYHTRFTWPKQVDQYTIGVEGPGRGGAVKWLYTVTQKTALINDIISKKV